MIFFILDLPGTNSLYRNVYVLRGKTVLEDIRMLVRTQAFLTDDQKELIVMHYNAAFHQEVDFRACTFYGYSGFTEL